MDKLRRQALYGRICDAVCNYVSIPEQGISVTWPEMLQSLGMTESTLSKVMTKQTKGLKLSIEQVVSISEVLGIDPVEFLKPPANQDDQIIQAISDLYDLCESKSKDLALTGFVQMLAKYFECEPVWMQGKLFELMEQNRIGVENGKFFEVVDEKA